MTLITEPILGMESIQREAFRIFFAQLNGAIDQINAFMAASDQSLATFTGAVYAPTVVEHVASENFYEGHRPSLIDAELAKYPNLAVWAVRTQSAPESAALDQMSISRTLLYVEIMAKAGPDEGEGILNRRLLRMAEAVNLCVVSNPTLHGIVNAADTEPAVTISEVFTRKERTAYGPHWFWQGARIEFSVRKEAVAPTQIHAPGAVRRTLHGVTQPLEEAAVSESGIPGISGLDYSHFIDQG